MNGGHCHEQNQNHQDSEGSAFSPQIVKAFKLGLRTIHAVSLSHGEEVLACSLRTIDIVEPAWIVNMIVRKVMNNHFHVITEGGVAIL